MLLVDYRPRYTWLYNVNDTSCIYCEKFCVLKKRILVFPFTGEVNLFRDVVGFLQQFYNGEEISRKVDRIIFVASAISKDLPSHLIRALVSQAMDGKRGKYF